jgi:hypothetical protein
MEAGLRADEIIGTGAEPKHLAKSNKGPARNEAGRKTALKFLSVWR